MRYFKKFLILLAFNAIGFLSAPFCYIVGIKTGTLDVTNPDFDPMILHNIVMGIMLTWMACAVFSLASLFYEGKIRFAFLLAPVVLPLAYGLSALFLGAL